MKILKNAGFQGCKLILGAIENFEEDPLWSSGHDTRIPNGKAVVRIRGSANAFEPKRIRICDHEASTPGESCGSSTQGCLLGSILLSSLVAVVTSGFILEN